MLGAQGLEVHGLEVAREDPEYRWKVIEGDGSTDRHTLFRDSNYGQLTRSEIARRVVETLTKLDPGAVAINGWAMPEALTALAWCRARRRVAILMSETFVAGSGFWSERVKSAVVGRFDAGLVGGEPHVTYAAALGLPRDRIFKGYDAVDNEHFAAGAARARANAPELRRQLGLPEHYFFANTRFIARKNVGSLLRAFARLRREHPSWSLVISGSGEAETEWKSLASELGLGDVRWPGFLQYDELPTYYGLAAAFVHPAISEPWGLVVNEAVSVGLPVLASRAVGARFELVEDGANGILFDPHDVDALERALRTIASLPSTRLAELGARSREISTHWTTRRFGEGLKSAIEAAIG
ncbi:MAG: glycosyltransferase family 4 protein [Deltaproteobacteria bacterium]|nr:glycosyltransferase family 4 protein [Deltaproteobacteria bacterium]